MSQYSTLFDSPIYHETVCDVFETVVTFSTNKMHVKCKKIPFRVTESGSCCHQRCISRENTLRRNHFSGASADRSRSSFLQNWCTRQTKSTMNGNYSYSQHQQPFDRQLHAQPQLIRQHQHRYDDRNPLFSALGSPGKGENPAPPPSPAICTISPPHSAHYNSNNRGFGSSSNQIHVMCVTPFHCI